MPLRVIAILLILAGIAMIIVGVVAKQFFAPQTFWSEQQAQEYLDASEALKVAATGTIRQPSPETDPRLAAAQLRFNKLQSELDWAIKRRNYTGLVLGTGGALLVAVGVALLLLGPRKKNESPDDLPPFIRRQP